MEATLNLGTIFEQEEFTPESYRTVQELAFANSESLNRFLQLLHATEEKTGTTGGNQPRQALKVGMCYLLLAKPEAAARWLEKAEDSAPRSYFLGVARLDQQRYADAALQFRQAAEQGWDALECSCLEAECLALMGECERAKETLGRNAAAGTGSAQWHHARGRLAEQVGDLDGAIRHFEEALEKDERHARSLFRLAYLLDLHGSDGRARELYRACAQLPIVHANALINLAILYEDDGAYEEAEDCLHRVLAVDPDSPRADLYMKDVLAACDMFIDEQQVHEDQTRSAVLDLPVTDFELSVRSRNCLKKMNIHTLGDLLRASEAELLAYKNFGETSLKEIKAMLSQKSLALGHDVHLAGGPAEDAALSPPAEPPKEPDPLANPVASLSLSMRSRKCLQRLGIETIGDLAAKTEAELLGSRNFGETSLSEIKECLKQIDVSLKASDKASE